MRIWIDIAHIPQFNFYKVFIQNLSQKGHTVFVTVLDRGRLAKIVKYELNGLPNVSVDVIGRHRMNKWSVIFEANLLRMPKLWWWALGKHIDVIFSNHHQTGIISKFLGCKPAYAFGDDTQTKNYWPFVHFSTKSHMLIYEDVYHTMLPGDTLMHCTKEWAYLAPSVFRPKVSALEKYNLKPKEYIFLREVSVGTVNYAGQAAGCILMVAPLIDLLKTADGKKMKVLFSLEEKDRKDAYPKDWILLQEPIQDIHSLIYYSAGLVSSGDSMAREAALLGVSSYYLGTRHSMPANLAATKVGGLQNELTIPFPEWLNTLQGTPAELHQKQEAKRAKINSEFIDINEYMLSLVSQIDK